MERPNNLRFWFLCLVVGAGILIGGGTAYQRWRQRDFNEELLNAINYGEVDRIKELLDQGANPNARGDANSKYAGLIPLEVAAFPGRRQVVELLLDHGADPRATDTSGNPVIFDATRSDVSIDHFQVMIKHGADIRAHNSNGETVLMAATAQNNLKLIQYLLGQGLDVNARNSKGQSAMDIANEQSAFIVARLLKQHGATLAPVVVGGYEIPGLCGWQRTVAIHPNGDASIEFDAQWAGSMRIGFYVLGPRHPVDARTFIPGEDRRRQAIIHPFMINSSYRLQHGEESRTNVADSPAYVRTDHLSLSGNAYDIRVMRFAGRLRNVFLTRLFFSSDVPEATRIEADIAWNAITKGMRRTKAQ